MRCKTAFSIALLLVACDTGAEHGEGHHNAMQVHMGRAPIPSQSAAEVAHAEHGAEAEAEAPDPSAAPAPTPAAAAPAEDAPVEAGDAAEAEAPEGEPEAAAEGEPEAAAEDAPAEDAPAEDAPAPAGARSEAEWTEAAKVRLGSSKIDGALDPDAVRKTVRSSSKDLKACYAKGLVKTPDLSGKLTMEFVVDKQGKMDSVKVKSSTLNNAEVESCATTTIEGWTFDAPDDGKKAKIRYSFSLSL